MRPPRQRPGFVALNLAHHMPVHAAGIRLRVSSRQPREFGYLLRRFLFARFANGPASQSGQNRDIGCWKEFGNGQQFNFADIAIRRFCGRRKP